MEVVECLPVAEGSGTSYSSAGQPYGSTALIALESVVWSHRTCPIKRTTGI